MSRFLVYALKDPDGGPIRYVGKTMYPQRRFRDHLYRAKSCTRRLPVSFWIRKLLDSERTPIFEELEWCESFDHMSSRERHWIAVHRADGKLLNLTDGGEGTLGYSVGPETRAKMSAIHRGKSVSAETRRKQSLVRAGRKLSAHHIARIREALNRPEVRDAISVGVRKAQTLEWRSKVSASLTGRVVTQEHRKKLSDALTGRTFSEETKAKLRANWEKKRAARRALLPV